MKFFSIKPARPGLIVRDPQTGTPLDEAGEKKPATTYWRRRLRDKDVVDAAATPTATKAKGGNSK